MPDEQNPKKKRTTPTHTSQAVIKRYQEKTYRRYNLMLRYDTDSDLIELIDRYMINGHSSPTQAIKAIMRGE